MPSSRPPSADASPPSPAGSPDRPGRRSPPEPGIRVRPGAATPAAAAGRAAKAGDDVPDLVLRAISFAARRHGPQMRKDRATPYVSHPFRVLFILSHAFGVRDPEVLAAGVLHDTIEDTTTDRDDIEREFGPRVAEWVATLSKDKRAPEKPREDAFFDALADAPVQVKLCKMADTLDNLLDVVGLGPEHGQKTREKARRLLARFDGRIPAEWRHAYEILRERAGP